MNKLLKLSLVVLLLGIVAGVKGGVIYRVFVTNNLPKVLKFGPGEDRKFTLYPGQQGSFGLDYLAYKGKWFDISWFYDGFVYKASVPCEISNFHIGNPGQKLEVRSPKDYSFTYKGKKLFGGWKKAE